jgi:hypothetical protein
VPGFVFVYSFPLRPVRRNCRTLILLAGLLVWSPSGQGRHHKVRPAQVCSGPRDRLLFNIYASSGLVRSLECDSLVSPKLEEGSIALDAKPVVLKVLLQHRHLQTHRAFCREYDRVATKVDSTLRGGWPSKAQFYRWLSGELVGLPYPDHCRILESMFSGWTVNQLFQIYDGGIDFIPEPDKVRTPAPGIQPVLPTSHAAETLSTRLESVKEALQAPADGRAGAGYRFDVPIESRSFPRSGALGHATDPGNDCAREAEIDNSCDPVKVSQRSWHDARKYVRRNQATLHMRAAELYPPSWRLPQAPMLSQPSWLPDVPIALEDIKLEWEPNPPKSIIVGGEPEARSLLPLRTRRQAFPSYSSAIRYLSPPALFENRPCYRLLDASLSGRTHACLRFGQSCYFDKIDVSEALVHELSSAMLNATDSRLELPFRSLISDPFDLAVRAVNTSIVTLTIRHDPTSGEATFFLLRRDPTKVVTGGGEYCLIPSGEFQPASVSPESVLSDLDIWRNIVREYSEELLGQPEHDGSTGRPVDYAHWPFFRAMQKARERGELRVYVLGIALHALSLNATIVTATVIDSAVFDSLFREAAKVNAEGEIVISWQGDKESHSLSFDEATISRFLHTEQQISSSAITGLSLAWQHRTHILDSTT